MKKIIISIIGIAIFTVPGFCGYGSGQNSGMATLVDITAEQSARIAADLAIGITTATEASERKTTDNAIAVSTTANQTDTNNLKVAVAISTTQAQSDLYGIGVSTWDLQQAVATEISNRGISEGLIGGTTGNMQSQIYAIGDATRTITGGVTISTFYAMTEITGSDIYLSSNTFQGLGLINIIDGRTIYLTGVKVYFLSGSSVCSSSFNITWSTNTSVLETNYNYLVEGSSITVMENTLQPADFTTVYKTISLATRFGFQCLQIPYAGSALPVGVSVIFRYWVYLNQ